MLYAGLIYLTVLPVIGVSRQLAIRSRSLSACFGRDFSVGIIEGQGRPQSNSIQSWEMLSSGHNGSDDELLRWAQKKGSLFAGQQLPGL